MAKPKKKTKKSNVLFYAFITLGMLACLALLLYPAVSNYFYGNIESHTVIKAYEEEIKAVDTTEKDAALATANDYNAMLASGIKKNDYDYTSLLNVSGSGVMATIEIPRITVNLPIYHGDTNDTLDKGAAHLMGTSLPVGGKSTHAVISAHTGMAGKEMFSDLEQLEKGDVFYIHILGDTLAYEVDDINVVEPWEMDRLHVTEGEDYVTLITCTPYGVNSHRLLVRGSRIPYEKAVEVQEIRQKEAAPVKSNWTKDYVKSLKLGGIVAGSVLLLFLGIIPGIKKLRLFILAKRKKKREEEDIAVSASVKSAGREGQGDGDAQGS